MRRITRREMLTGCAAIVLSASASLAGGCVLSTAYLPITEPHRILSRERMPRFDAERTGYPKAVQTLKKIGVSNLAAAIGNVPDDGNAVYMMLTGDALNRVYVFKGINTEECRFLLELPMHAFSGSDGLRPTDVSLYLKAVTIGRTSAAMVVGPELIDEHGNIGIIVLDNDDTSGYSTIRSIGFELWHTGVNLPIIKGTDLVTGVYFTARDNDGSAWDYAYLIQYENGKPAVKDRILTQKLLDCPDCELWFYNPRKWLNEKRAELLLQ
jgi:hypothetical protein